MRLELLLMLMVVSPLRAIGFTVMIYDTTPGLYYDHGGQVQLYASECKLRKY